MNVHKYPQSIIKQFNLYKIMYATVSSVSISDALIVAWPESNNPTEFPDRSAENCSTAEQTKNVATVIPRGNPGQGCH